MGRIKAKVVSIKKGFDLLEGLNAIKVVSKDYNILIMEDYLPVIGQIDGSVTFVGEEETKTYEGIVGYYRHSHNEFELLIKSEKND